MRPIPHAQAKKAASRTARAGDLFATTARSVNLKKYAKARVNPMLKKPNSSWLAFALIVATTTASAYPVTPQKKPPSVEHTLALQLARPKANAQAMKSITLFLCARAVLIAQAICSGCRQESTN